MLVAHLHNGIVPSDGRVPCEEMVVFVGHGSSNLTSTSSPATLASYRAVQYLSVPENAFYKVRRSGATAGRPICRLVCYYCNATALKPSATLLHMRSVPQ